MDKAAAVLRQVGLAGKERESSKMLSYGDRAGAGDRRGAGSGARILFLDRADIRHGHPGHGSPGRVADGLEDRYTMVIIEHDMKFWSSWPNRISVIHSASVIAEGSPAELRANKWRPGIQPGKLA